MTSSPSASDAALSLRQPPIESWRWGIVWLMFLATMLAYMDRQTMGSTAGAIKKEFNLSEQDYGWLEFCFGITFGLIQIPAGFLADRFNVRFIYAGALVVWSLAGFMTGMVETVYLLMVCRLVLGFGEAFNWPCAVGIVRRVMPLESRAMANGIFHSGASIGAVATPLLAIGLAWANIGTWRLLFQIVGALGMLWAVLWFLCIHGQRAEAISRPLDTAPNSFSDEPENRPAPFWHMFLLRTFWITLAVGIAVNICWHFYRVWLPRYLDVDLKFAQENIQWVLIGFFIPADLGAMFFGWLTRRLTRAGYGEERARKIVLLTASLVCTLSMPAVMLGNAWLTLPLIFLVAAGSMGGFPIFFALAQEVSPRHTSLCLGICGMTAWLVLIAIHPPAGALADRIGTFVPSLIAVGFVPLVGAFILFLWPETQRPELSILPEESGLPAAVEEHVQAIEDRMQAPRMPPEV